MIGENYKEDLKVFGDLEAMPEEEIKAKIEKMEKANKFDEELESLKKYLESYISKSIKTEDDMKEFAEKRNRYIELEALRSVEGEKQDLSSDETKSDIQRCKVYLKIRPELQIALRILNKAKEQYNAVHEKTVKAFDQAIRVDKIDKEMASLDEYMEAFQIKKIITDEDLKIYDEKMKQYEELSEEKKNLPQRSIEQVKIEMTKLYLPVMQTMKIAENAIKFMTDKANWDPIEKMSKQELRDTSGLSQVITPKRDPNQKPGQDPNQKPGQDPNQKPGQDPNQKPGQDPNQKPGQDPNQKPGQDPNQNPEQDPKIDKRPLIEIIGEGLAQLARERGEEDQETEQNQEQDPKPVKKKESFLKRLINKIIGNKKEVEDAEFEVEESMEDEWEEYEPGIFERFIDGVKDTVHNLGRKLGKFLQKDVRNAQQDSAMTSPENSEESNFSQMKKAFNGQYHAEVPEVTQGVVQESESRGKNAQSTFSREGAADADYTEIGDSEPSGIEK